MTLAEKKRNENLIINKIVRLKDYFSCLKYDLPNCTYYTCTSVKNGICEIFHLLKNKTFFVEVDDLIIIL